MVNNETTSEASPLLKRPSDADAPPSQTSDQVVSESIGNDDQSKIHRNGMVEDQNDGESQGDGERAQQFEGMPDVKKQLKYILPAVGIGIFLAAADQTIIVSCYGKIGSDLEALNKSSWIATSYFLTLTSFQPLYGKTSDIFGRKEALLFAYTIFGLGCLLCGLARTMDELIAARAFAGIGGGGMTTVVSILMSDIVPLRERGTWQGIINIIYASGAGFGAPIGGLLADTTGWRIAFLAQAPMCALAIVCCAFALKLPKNEVSDWKTKVRRIDFFGAVLLIIAIFALLLGFDRGSNDRWSSPLAIVPLCLFVPLTALFLVREFRYAEEPFAPKRIVFERSLIGCYLCNFFSFAAWFAILFQVPLWFQAVDDFNASQAGLRITPAIVSSVTGSLTGGIIMQKTGKYYLLTVFAYLISSLGIVFVILFTGLVLNNTYGISVGLVLGGFGNGIGVTSTLIGMIANAKPEDQAIATACSYLFRSLGSTIGVSISATVFQQSLRMKLKNSLGSGKEVDDIVKNVRQSLGYIESLRPEIQRLVRDCYCLATRDSFFLMIGLALGATTSSWFIREKMLSK